MIVAASRPSAPGDHERATLIVVFVLKVLVALIVIAVGSLFIYAFGAGYLSGFGVWLPTPWNFVASGGLFIGLVAAAVRMVREPWHERRGEK
jgi:membrane protein implicated in regulation of membrane protease activity